MKILSALSIMTTVMLSGCVQSHPMSAQKSGDRSSEESETSGFDAAIETIATSEDKAAVLEADARLRSGGLPAIHALRQHLDDARIPATDYLTRAVLGQPNLGDHCFWLIQDMIEAPVPKLYHAQYSVLTYGNVEQWLDERSDKTLQELRLDAATTSLERAKAEFEDQAMSSAQQAMELYQDRITDLGGHDPNTT